MQAQFQAQQMAEKEKRIMAMMESRQEEMVRRISGGGHRGVDSAPHSATSLSSNNSSATSFTAGLGQRPTAPYNNNKLSSETSPVGWDKSYPLKPMKTADPGLPPSDVHNNHHQSRPMYKKNSAGGSEYKTFEVQSREHLEGQF